MIIIKTDISPAHPIRRVHVQIDDVFDYCETYDDTDDLETVLRSVGIGIKKKKKK